MKHRITIIYLPLLALVGASLPTVRAQTSSQAGLVVRFGDGSVVTRCIEFSESEISGHDLLMRSGLNIVDAFDPSQGAAICSIEGKGCPASSCLTCDVPNYWSYWHLADGSWVYSQAGASNRKVHSGDVDGWQWGSGDSPPVVPFDQICTPPPTATPQPTDTPIPPTATPLPTDTPQPTDTPPPPTDTPAPKEETLPTPVVWFRLDENPIPAGACTTVRWDTSNVQEIYLNGERVDLNSSIKVCPTASQEYHLRVMSAEEEKTHTLVLGVAGSAPSPTFTPQPAAPAPATETATATPLPPSPTPTPVESLPPSSTPTVQPVAATPTPSSTPGDRDPELDETTPTPAQIAARSSSALPAPTVQPQPTPTPSSDKESFEPFLPTSYIIFSLITGGLLGWLVFVVTNRNRPEATCTE
jgi:hypothetical protein